MRPLLELVPERRLDLDYLAEFLVLPFGGAQELHTERCAYAGVHRVLAGTRLEVSPGGSPKSIRWWDWLAQWKSPRASSRQTSQPVTGNCSTLPWPSGGWAGRRLHLSGGMDSTAVALLAARQAHAACEEPVHGLALVYERQNVLSRERPYVESVDGTPGLQLHRLPGEECLDFDAYDYAIDPDEPVLSLYQSAMCHALLKRAAEIGGRTLMTGFGADELVGLQPFPLYDHLRTGRWFTAWREASALAAARSDSSWKYLSQYGFRFFFARRSAWWIRLLAARWSGSLGKATSPHDRSVGAAGICPAARTVAALGRTPAPPIEPLPSAGSVDGARVARIRYRGRLSLGSRCAGRCARRAAVS